MNNKKIAVLTLLAFSLLIYEIGGCRNNGKAEAVSPPVESSPELIVIGKLESIEKSTYCGTFYFGAVAKYTDLTIIKGKYTKKEIFVVHGCPEMLRKMISPESGNLKKFQVGDYHELYLSKTNIHKIEIIVGDKGVPEDEKYFCKTVNLKK